MRTSKVVIGAALLAMGAAACGTSGNAQSKGGAEPLHAVETAYSATLKAKTADVSITESIRAQSSSGSNESSTVTGSGQLDLSANAFRLSLNAPSGGSEEVLEIGGMLYLQVPPAQISNVPGQKPWESIDLDQVDEAKLGKSFSQLNSLSSDDPAQALSDLASVSDTVTKVGTAIIDGVTTTRYQAQVSLSKVAARTAAKEGAQAGDAVSKEAQSLGTSVLPVTVWVDNQGLVRQIREQIPIPAASTGATNGNGTATVTITFSAFGTPVQLTPPPATEVADITAKVVQQAGS